MNVGLRTHWAFPVDVVPKAVAEVSVWPRIIETTDEPMVGSRARRSKLKLQKVRVFRIRSHLCTYLSVSASVSQRDVIYM